MNRFEWLKAVLQAGLPARASTLASALAVEFCNDETGQINPAIETLARYLGWSKDTVRRAIADLSSAGWLNRFAGDGRGNKSRYVLLSPGAVVPLRPHKGSQNSNPLRKIKGRNPAPKGSQPCSSHIRKEQSSEQRAGARPCSHLHIAVVPGSEQHERWDAWLDQRGLPPLDQMQRLRRGEVFDLLHRRPPSPGSVEEMLNDRFFAWAMASESEGDHREAG